MYLSNIISFIAFVHKNCFFLRVKFVKKRILKPLDKNLNKIISDIFGIVLMFFLRFLAQAAAEDREAHERSSAGSGKPADRRIDIQPAEDEEGSSYANIIQLFLCCRCKLLLCFT